MRLERQKRTRHSREMSVGEEERTGALGYEKRAKEEGSHAQLMICCRSDCTSGCSDGTRKMLLQRGVSESKPWILSSERWMKEQGSLERVDGPLSP